MTITVEDGLRRLMPEVALDYLHGIVRSDATIGAIRLAPASLPLDSVQEIFCESQTGTSRRRVFGFTPVSASLDVLRREGEAVIRLASQQVG